MTVVVRTTGGDTTPLVELIGYLNTIDERALRIAHRVALEVFNDIRQQILQALRFYPPVPPGSTYIRTFRLRRGWQVDLHLRADTIELVVFNRTPYTPFVVGALTTDEAQARRTQQLFHARNGWPLALDTSRLWFDRYREAFIEAFVEAIIDDVRAQV